MKFNLDLLGVVAQFGNEITTGSIRYINANPKRCFMSFLVVPGLYDISKRVLKRSNDTFSRMMSPGQREDKKELVGLSSSGKYKYIGTQSGTICNVMNVLCEGWLNKTLTMASSDSFILQKGNKNTPLIVSSLTGHSYGEELKYDKNDPLIWSSIWQAGTLASFGYMCMFTKDMTGIIISAANMMSSILVSSSIALDKYTIPDPRVTPNVPPGNAIITDNDGNNLCVVEGDEKVVQSFMQHPVNIGTKRKQQVQNDRYGFAAAAIGCVTSICTVLFTPMMCKQAQLVFAIELLMGLASCVTFSSRDGDVMLESMAHKYYGNALDKDAFDEDASDKIPSQKITYTNRSSAIAAALIKTKGLSENIGNLLPKSDVNGNWALYKQLLDQVVANWDNLPRMHESLSLADAVNTMNTKFPDTAGVLSKRHNWAPRLVEDVLEAIVQLQGEKPDWCRSS